MENCRRFGNRIGHAWRKLRLGGGAPAVFLLLLTTFYLDWSPGSDEILDGQLRILLLAGSALLYQIGRRLSLPGSIALFWSYMALMCVLRNYPSHGLGHLAYFSAALITATWLARARHLELLLSLLGTFQAVFGLAQWWGWNPWGYEPAWYLNKPSGFFGQETLLGALLVACLAPALFSKRWWAAVPILACIVATHSSMTAAGAGAVVLLWMWRELKPMVTLYVAAGGVAVLLLRYCAHPDDAWFDPNGRLLFWRWAYHRWLEQPLFGFGPGSWLPNAPTFELTLTHAHNEYLEFLTEYGAVGALPLLWGIARFARGFRLTWHHALVVGLMVNAVGNFPFHIASLGVIFLTAWLISVPDKSTVLELKRYGG